MTMADSGVRQRKTDKEPSYSDTPEQPSQAAPKKSKKKSKKVSDDEVEYENRWVDAARVLTFLFVVSCGLSYLVSSGESFFWSMKVPPKYLRAEWWKSHWVWVPSSCLLI